MEKYDRWVFTDEIKRKEWDELDPEIKKIATSMLHQTCEKMIVKNSIEKSFQLEMRILRVIAESGSSLFSHTPDSLIRVLVSLSLQDGWSLDRLQAEVKESIDYYYPKMADALEKVKKTAYLA